MAQTGEIYIGNRRLKSGGNLQVRIYPYVISIHVSGKLLYLCITVVGQEWIQLT